VLPTIVSRCQQVEFRPLSDEQVATYLRERYGLGGAEAAALARLSGGAVERAQRLADDARGPGRRAKFLKQVALLLAGVRGDKAADAQRVFINVLEQQHLEIKGAIETDLEKRLDGLEQQFQDDRDRKWYVKKAVERAKREEGRLRRIAAQDAVDLLGAWVRDLWVVACGASDVLWNCDRADELAGAAVATPEYYARLMAVVARTRKDLYLNIDQKLALQALFARFEEVAESA
jgi:DNA polymerase-3 subunit delta'